MKLLPTLVLSLSVGLSTRSFAAPPLNEILAALEQANEQIGVVKVEGYTHQYTWDDSISSWRVTPETSTFTCTFENKPQGRYVLDENPAITRWESGAAPYMAEWSTQFRDADGYITWWRRAFQHRRASSMTLRASVTQWWDWSTQPEDGALLFVDPVIPDNTIDRGKKSAFSRAMAQSAERFWSGLGFTGYRAIRNSPAYAPDRFKGVTVSDTKDGLVSVHFESPELCVAWDFVLDPRKNFALVRYAYSQNRALTTADGEMSQTYEVLEHRQIADGVWYPIHCTVTMGYSREYAAFLRSEDAHRADLDQRDPYSPHKSELVLTNVSLLAGTNAEANLSVNLPEGTTIIDEDQHQ